MDDQDPQQLSRQPPGRMHAVPVAGGYVLDSDEDVMAHYDYQPTGTVSASTSSGFKSVPFSTLQPPNRARKPKVITLDDLVATRWSWVSGLSIISVSQVAFCVN